MGRLIGILCAYISLILLSSCDSFENRFYNSVEAGQVKAIYANNSSDNIFDLSTITDFEWDSVLVFRGNESVPIFSEQIEPILKRKTIELPINVDRFYFLTTDKKLIVKEIKSGIHLHKPGFDIDSCLPDSSNEWYWFSRKERKFVVKSNSRKIGEGTVFLIPQCKIKFSPDIIKFID